MGTLEKLRKQIDETDKKIKKLLDRRFALSEKVGEYKAENNLQVTDGGRERQIYGVIENDAGLKYKNEIIAVYKGLLKESRAVQVKITEERKTDE